jgi:putative endonuclease
MKRTYYVYILTNVHKTVLYTGITNNLQQRIVEHYLDTSTAKTFCGRYNVYFLLHYEVYNTPMTAINREKQIKGWTRKKKIDLIQIENPFMNFLNETIFDKWPPDVMFHRKDL